MGNYPAEDALLIGILGYGTVILVLALVALVVFVVVRKLTAGKKAAVVEAAPAAEEPEAPQPTAPGAAGQLKLHDVEPKTAAMLMAIVADKLGKPINELRFISIKEVK